MSELHTDDTFMYENCLVGDAGMNEDPLVNRITHQRGPKVPYSFNVAVEGGDVVDWDEAPTWANYWAMDANEEAFWFNSEPEIAKGSLQCWSNTDEKLEKAPSFGLPSDLWQESLTERPAELEPDQEKAVDELVRDAEELGLYDDTPANELNGPMQRQVSGSHYNKYAIQPAEYCYKNGLNNLQSEAISYITRYGDKGGKTDLEKAIHTLEMLIHMEYGE